MSEDFFENKNTSVTDGESRDGNSFSVEKSKVGGQRAFRRERVNYAGGSYEKARYGSYDRGYSDRRSNGYGYSQQRNGDTRGAYSSQRPNGNRFSKYGSSNADYSGEGRFQGGETEGFVQRSYRPRYQQGNGRVNSSEGYQTQNRSNGFGERRYNKNSYYGESRRNNFGQENSSTESGYTPGYNRRDSRNGYSSSNGQSSYGAGYGMNGYGTRRNYSSNYNPHAKYSQKKRLEYKEKNYDPNEPLRLNKYLANAGVCSRRDADKFITSGVVSVNGQIVTELGTKVLRSDVVLFHDQQVKMEKKVYVLLNKPKGYVTTSDDPQNRKTVMELVKNACPERIYPVGRLDRNTTGVLLFTNDGELASKLTHPKFMKKKIYHVYTDKNVTAADIQQIAEGITLEDGDIKADAIEYASPTDKKQVGIEIHSGKNRIVRRIFEHLGYHVVKLDRVYFAGLTKKNVKRGDWRYLTEKEVDMLRMGAFE